MNISRPNPRSTCTLEKDGTIVCRSTQTRGGRTAAEAVLLTPSDTAGFRGATYAALQDYLSRQPEGHAVVTIEDGHIQPAD